LHFFSLLFLFFTLFILQNSGNKVDLKIADFGLSALVRIDEGGYDAEESGKRKTYKLLQDMWGTKEYFAPEVINEAYGPQADMWALGCVLFEMLSGDTAFQQTKSESELFVRIVTASYDTTK
jgi:serine/threonine protein kinase